MGHKLKYTIGNAGDIIKHGLLTEFVAWWSETHANRVLRMADPFGGCPWGNLEELVKKRLETLSGTVLAHAQKNGGKGRKYLGSGHLIHQAAKDCCVDVCVLVSDKDEGARRDLKDSGLDLIEPRLLDDDGYGILDAEYSQIYDLILLDPYREFLRDECRNSNKRFDQIRNEVNKNSDLFIAVFVLDMNTNNSVGRNFAKYKESQLSDWAFSIRCPKMENSRFDWKILLVSRQIKDCKCERLYERLQSFVEQAERALKTSLELWGR